MIDELREIKGFDKYFISSKGDVYSDKYHIRRRLKPRKNAKGYLYVNLCKNGKYKSIEIQRLVAQEFLEDFNPSLQVNHIDGNKQNNSVDNLEMATQAENMKHAINTELLIPKKGEEHWASKLTEKDVLDIRNLYKNGSRIKDISEKYKSKVSRETISQIVNNKIWKHVKSS